VIDRGHHLVRYRGCRDVHVGISLEGIAEDQFVRRIVRFFVPRAGFFRRAGAFFRARGLAFFDRALLLPFRFFAIDGSLRKLAGVF